MLMVMRCLYCCLLVIWRWINVDVYWIVLIIFMKKFDYLNCLILVLFRYKFFKIN